MVRLCLLLALTLASVGASRQSFDLFASSEDAVAGLRSSVQGLLGLMRDGLEHHEGGYTAYMAVRYIVPPGEGRKFEDRWLDLEKDVMKHEKEIEVFDLKKHTLDNLIYRSYGEWNSHCAAHGHASSKHFEDFADWVDDHGIRWELEILKNLSEDVEEEEEEKGRHEQEEVMLGRRKHREQREQDEQDEQDEQLSVSRRLLEDDGQLESRRHSKKKGHSKQDQEDVDWEKYVPKEYRRYIPKHARPSHKKDKCKRQGSKSECKRHSRKNELSEAVLATLPNNGVDADASTVLGVWKELSRKRDLHHVLITYIVPPGEGEGFTDAWLDAAEDTVQEKHNRIYSLRKVATDNTRFYGYGTWDSMGDFLNHFESKHVGKLIDYTADKDIVWFVTPLTKIGNERE